MDTEVETDWQPKRTLAECMKYMLDNEISTDVCFEVGPPGGDTVKLRAHKYMLISRSPVFQAMFSSGMTECKSDTEAKVRIEDIDADVFKEMLNYMYCESASICPESSVYLMNAGRKYFLPKLVGECRECLLKGLNLSNIIHFLELSLQFDHQQLVTDCLKLISLNGKAFFARAEIVSVSRQAMEAILGAGSVPVSETVIYETTINWAKRLLRSEMPAETPTDLQIRNTLGDLLYKIRFPIMKLSEFAEISSGNCVLTEEEKLSIYYFLATKKKNCQLNFPAERRIGDEVWVDRTFRSAEEPWFSSANLPSARRLAINFTADQDILLTGIGLYTTCKEKEYNVDVEILRSVKSLSKKRVTVPYSGDSNPFKISFDKPIVIRARLLYSVKALSDVNVRDYGDECRQECAKDSVKFTFSKHTESQLIFVTYGQIPILYFCRL